MRQAFAFRKLRFAIPKDVLCFSQKSLCYPLTFLCSQPSDFFKTQRFVARAMLGRPTAKIFSICNQNKGDFRILSRQGRARVITPLY
jgi:hypothetical protein